MAQTLREQTKESIGFLLCFFFLYKKTLSKGLNGIKPQNPSDSSTLFFLLLLLLPQHKFLSPNPFQCFFRWIEEIYKREREREVGRESGLWVHLRKSGS